MTQDIRLVFENPPIPQRVLDWSATRDGYEPGDPVGRGATPEAALADLFDWEAWAKEEAAQ